jgi:DNA-binding response OmpR family regulator
MPDPADSPSHVSKVRQLLLVDDDVELCGLLEAVLVGRGFRMSFAYDGASGLVRALGEPYDLVLLDMMLPGMNGLEVLRQLRRRTTVPIIMLTARGEEGNGIRALEAGADDYVLKPFAVDELLARIRAVIRRTRDRSQAAPGVAQAGPVRIDTITGQARSGERLLNLTAIEFALLDLLVREAGRIVSRDEICGVLYHRQAGAYERALDVHMSHLRKKLAPEATERIRTVRGIGYIFTLPE